MRMDPVVNGRDMGPLLFPFGSRGRPLSMRCQLRPQRHLIGRERSRRSHAQGGSDQMGWQGWPPVHRCSARVSGHR